MGKLALRIRLYCKRALFISAWLYLVIFFIAKGVLGNYSTITSFYPILYQVAAVMGILFVFVERRLSLKLLSGILPLTVICLFPLVYPRPFESGTWKEANPKSKRARMVFDLIESKVLIGHAPDTVEVLLGKPEHCVRGSFTPNGKCYKNFGYFVEFSEACGLFEEKLFLLEWSKEGRVSEASMKCVSFK